MNPSAAAPPPPSFWQAFRYWLQLGFISFGGPAGQIALMREDLVERKRWISERRFLHALNYCMVLPGPEAQQLATYIGWLLYRSWGGIVAGGLFVQPSWFILMGLSWVYMAYGDVPVVAGVFYGIKPAVTAIVVSAAWRISTRALRSPVLWAMAVAALVAIFALQLPFPAIVLAAGVIGYGGGRRASSPWAAAMAPPPQRTVRPSLTTTPRHRRTRALVGAVWCACCWCAWGCGRPSWGA